MGGKKVISEVLVLENMATYLCHL